MLMPQAQIEEFLGNIRKMMVDPERKDMEAFKTLIEAFDQLNKERAHIVENQGKVIVDFSEKIAKFDPNNKDSATNNFSQIGDYIKTLNKGDLFAAATAKSSFEQINDGSAKTRGVKSVTGSGSLGTNKLFKF